MQEGSVAVNRCFSLSRGVCVCPRAKATRETKKQERSAKTFRKGIEVDDFGRLMMEIYNHFPVSFLMPCQTFTADQWQLMTNRYNVLL